MQQPAEHVARLTTARSLYGGTANLAETWQIELSRNMTISPHKIFYGQCRKRRAAVSDGEVDIATGIGRDL